MFNLDSLDFEIISLIKKENSFAAIAKRLGVAPSTISDRMKKIEAYCAGHMIVRKPGRFGLTEVGVKLEALTSNIAEQSSLFRQDLDNLKKMPQALRIMANPSLLISDAYPVIQKMHGLFPQLEIHMLHGNYNEITEGVDLGNIDVGLVLGVIPTKSLIFFPYRKESVVILTSRNHPLAKLNRSINFHEATHHKFIKYSEPGELTLFLREAEKMERLKIGYKFDCPNMELAANLIDKDDSLAAIVIQSIAKRFANLHTISLRDVWAVDFVAMCTRDAGLQTQAGIQFTRLLRLHFAKMN